MKIPSCCFTLALVCATSLAHATWVEVEEQGSTVDEAKQRCFNSAIRQVVGELIVSDIEVSGDAITKDFIGSYSAGYVNDYEIQQTYYDDSRVTLHMQVDVSSSKIAERMRTNSDYKTILNGEKLDTKIDTILQQRTKGDRILSNVLSSYPHNAYILNSGETSAVVGIRRQVYIDIPYEIQWSRYWLEALVESLDAVALESRSCRGVAHKELERLSLTVSAFKFFQDKACGQDPDIIISRKNPKDWLIKKSSFYFPDLVTLDIINNEVRNPFGRQHVGLVVDLKDASGSIVGTRCARIPIEPLINYVKHSQEVESIHGNNPRPRIHGDVSITGTVRVESEGLNLSRVSRLDMHLEKTCN